LRSNNLCNPLIFRRAVLIGDVVTALAGNRRSIGIGAERRRLTAFAQPRCRQRQQTLDGALQAGQLREQQHGITVLRV